MGMRRILARGARMTSQDVWPINEAAGQAPAGWRGWPDGKKFALVLTHDVEGNAGLNKCGQLMGLEKKLGFRSSFNLIPEGEYPDAPELRAELARNGFEVGVHDLRHDGKLYWSRGEFAEKARRINRYLKAWDASGFRPGFMLHNPDWLEGLDSEYDASAVDTDPFEPDPWTVETIFPFWVPRARGGGYVELPYTLPQDSTLFLVLREKSPEIWKRKLDWIVKRGGMALMDVHPDYLGFDENRRTISEYPAAWYEEFLHYVRDQYGGQYWNPLPRELARWYKGEYAERAENPAAPDLNGAGAPVSLKGKRAAVVLYSYYEEDPRPRREAEALSQAGMEVEVICLRKDASVPLRTRLNGVSVYHAPLRRRRTGKLVYVFQYAWFLAVAFALLAFRSLRRRYDLVHVHNMPDFLVFSGLAPKILGAQILLDLHDPMPELLVTIFRLRPDSPEVRLLKLLEQWSVGFADHVLTVNLACQKIFTARGCAPEKIQVLMNAPDESIFKYRRCADHFERSPGRPFVIMFHGSIVERNGLDIAVEALRLLRPAVAAAELRVYGAATPFLEQVLATAARQGLEHAVHYLGAKTLEEIVAAIGECDVGVIPNRNNAFTAINTPTRIFEYLSQGKPVVAPCAEGITDYFGPDEMLYFELGSPADLARQLEMVFRNPAQAQAVTRRGQAVYLRECWSQAREKFLGRVSDMLRQRH